MENFQESKFLDPTSRPPWLMSKQPSSWLTLNTLSVNVIVTPFGQKGTLRLQKVFGWAVITVGKWWGLDSRFCVPEAFLVLNPLHWLSSQYKCIIKPGSSSDGICVGGGGASILCDVLYWEWTLPSTFLHFISHVLWGGLPVKCPSLVRNKWER